MALIGQRVKVIHEVKGQIFKNAPIELKFTWNDPCDILNTLKIQWRS